MRLFGFLKISIFIGTVAIYSTSVNAASNHLNKLNILKKDENNYQFTLSFTKRPELTSFTLSQPTRLVLDFKNTDFVKLNLPKEKLKQSPVVKIRSGLLPDHTLRVVFDLNPITQHTLGLPRWTGGEFKLSLQFTLSNKTQPMLATHKGALKALPLKTQKRVTLTQIRNFSAPSSSRPVIILVDPGHGGQDPGAIGREGTQEKRIVLPIAQYLVQNINKKPGFKAYLSRTGDYYVTLRQRLAIARRYKADMFVAIHADAYRNPHARGASVFALSSRGATSEAARWLAKKENESELMGGVNLADKTELLKSVLLDLSQTATIRSSLGVGQQIIRFLDDVGELHHHRVEQAAFVVLKSPDIPSLLVETGYISNFAEERKLRNSMYQKHIAYAIAKGIDSYFEKAPPPNTWLAEQKFHLTH